MRFEKLPEIVSMSDMIFESYWALEFHVGGSHELVHVVNGQFDLELKNGIKFNAQPGDTLIIPSGTSHRDAFDLNEDLEVFQIIFKWDLLDQYSHTVTLENINDLDSKVKSELKRLFDQMRFDSGDTDLDREIANSRLLTALLLIYRDVNSETEQDDTEVDSGKQRRQKMVIEAKRYIDKNFRDPIQLIDVSEQLQVSPFYLSRIFARESDFSLVSYLTDIRINAAKELLKDGRYIVADVAQMVGYHDGNYFAKVFKRMVGCSPTKYR